MHARDTWYITDTLYYDLMFYTVLSQDNYKVLSLANWFFCCAKH